MSGRFAFARRDRGGDDLDADAWRLTCAIVTAASHIDDAGLLLATRNARKVLPEDSPSWRWLFFYEWWMLRHKLVEILGVDSTRKAISGLAESSFPRYARLLTSEQGRLEAAFLTALEMNPVETKMLPGEFVIVGGVALGLLLHDPEAELDRMRPILAGYVVQHEQKVRALLGL